MQGPSAATRAIALAALLLAAEAGGQVPTFTGVGDLAGGATGSVALAISSDGNVVVGESESTSGTQAFRWTSGGGMVGLGFLSMADPWSSARGVSSNGSVIAGSSRDASGVVRAWRWSGSSLTALNTLSCNDCDPVTEGFGLSGDGLVVVGSAVARGSGSSPLHLDPVRWPAGGTAINDLGNLPSPQEAGEAFGVSSTGSVIAGGHFSNDGKDAWTSDGSGLDPLPRIFGGTPVAATALAVSADGSTVVGYSSKGTVTLPGGTVLATDLQAVRWTGSGFATVTQLGSLPGAVSIDSRALAVSPDGQVIVGRAVDGEFADRAFLWSAADGMRDLKTVLGDDYGLDLTGWVLSEALGVSQIVDGAFRVVGRGINPQGQPEGWVAYLTTPACSDGDDNDSDGPVDFPADTGCRSATDWSEQPDCADGIDDDGDGDIDHPDDAGCLSASDPSEQPACSDGLDNDGDLLLDHPDDPGCATPQSPVEDPACSDAADNDSDTFFDHPDDPECLTPSDASETADCGDGLDNDGDTLTDHPADPECESAADLSEGSQCADGIDNDGDGRTDYPAQYPGCLDAADPIEAAQCSDGVDNDGDSQSDFPADPECESTSAESEDPERVMDEGLLVVDRESRTLFRVDKTTGAQTLISEKALLQAPQGLVLRGHEVVVADPAGLVAVQGSGAQRFASPPLLPHDSLQVVLDAAGDPYVLEADGLSKVAWLLFAPGSKSTWLTVPTPGPLPALGAWHGDSLALEASGDFVAGGLSIFGDGVYRVDASTQAVSILEPGFAELRWLDLAVEADGTILAAGFEYDLGTGVYRIDPSSGVATALNNSYGWQRPTGIAVDADGDIYVADSGVCADGACAGGEIVHVDPTTGAATPLSSGGFIAGEMDVIAVPEPGRIWLLASGVLGLAALQGLRTRRRR
jgi:probable HAF family extracellular repeat protein